MGDRVGQNIAQPVPRLHTWIIAPGRAPFGKLPVRTLGMAHTSTACRGDKIIRRTDVNAAKELLENLATRAGQKARHDQPRCAQRGLRLRQAQFVLARHAHRSNGLVILLISGTASIDEHGQSIHIGDFRAQLRRTYPQHHRSARERRRYLARHRPYHVLPARHRPRLRQRSTKSAPPSSRSRASIRCPLPPASRPNFAAPNCSSRSKPSPCSAPRRPRTSNRAPSVYSTCTVVDSLAG